MGSGIADIAGTGGEGRHQSPNSYVQNSLVRGQPQNDEHVPITQCSHIVDGGHAALLKLVMLC